MIVIEGPDGSGKSTLAKALCAKYGYEYHHEGPPKTPDVLQQYAGLLFKGVFERGGKVVFDRLHLGENVYGPILRGKSLINDFEGLALLHRVMSAYRVHCIICLPPYEVCRANWIARKKLELIENEDQFLATYETYARYAADLVTHKTVRYTLYDYTKDAEPYGKVTPTPSIPTYANWIGSHLPKFLIAGEVANHPWLDLPFMSLTGSSHYLNEALWDADYLEEEMAFVNSVSLTGEAVKTSKLRFTFYWPKSPLVISLGGVASEIWIQANKRIPHPAYWKRFHANERTAYVEELRRFRELNIGR
jgi:hypothetical protein